MKSFLPTVRVVIGVLGVACACSETGTSSDNLETGGAGPVGLPSQSGSTPGGVVSVPMSVGGSGPAAVSAPTSQAVPASGTPSGPMASPSTPASTSGQPQVPTGSGGEAPALPAASGSDTPVGAAGSPAPVGDPGGAGPGPQSSAVAGAGGSSETGGVPGGGGAPGGSAGMSTGGGGGSGPIVNVVGETGTETIPGNGCVSPGAYANLFVALSGHTQQESDAKIQAAWNQLYNPSNPNTVYYDGPGQDESYVEDTGSNDVRTEGMSYGMMTAVQLDEQEPFDRIWAWVKNHMAQGTGEIAWHCSTSGSKLSNGGAPDGEEYMATALIFAHNRWGDTGRFDYASEAQWVLDLIRTKYFNEQYHIIKFVSSSNNTDGSYVLPSFYQVWACFDSANADFWNEAMTAGREFFHAAADSRGVIPDQSSFTGQSQGSAGSDAKRCVMNIMMDHNFFAADPWQTDTYAPAFGMTMANGGDGTAAQFSCNALLGFGLPESSGKSFVDRLWSAQIPTGTYRYYDGTLYMLSLLHVSGTFKLYY